MKKKIIANFFWNNNNLSLYDYCCLKSFLKNNFEVHVYSFEKIKLPFGAKLKDASKIINKKEIKKFIHQGKKGCLAAFADKFRIELLKRNKGWWFDMDILCLKKETEFRKLDNKEIIIGLETDTNVNNAVLKISNQEFLNMISFEISKLGYVINWGDIGPKLLNKLLHKENKFSKVFGKKYFYPIDYKNFNYLLLPRYYSEAKKICKDSFTIHNYNQILNRFGIPKNIMPTKGSLLYKKFLEYSPELKTHATLPENTAERLLNKKNGFKENLKDLLPSLIRSFK